MHFSLATFYYLPLIPSYSPLYCGPIHRQSGIAPRILTNLRYNMHIIFDMYRCVMCKVLWGTMFSWQWNMRFRN